MGDITCLSVRLSVHAKNCASCVNYSRPHSGYVSKTVEIKMYQWRESAKGSREISKQFRWVLSSAMGTEEAGMNNREKKPGEMRNRGGERERGESTRLKERDSGPSFCFTMISSSRFKIFIHHIHNYTEYNQQ